MFSFFKKKPQAQVGSNNILLAMPVFNNNDSFDVEKIIESLKTEWDCEATNIEGDENVIAFNIDGESVAIAFMPVPILLGDIEGTAQYAYNWPKAAEELRNHTGHAIVSIMAGQKRPLEKFKILSKIVGSILATSDAIGVYQGTQSLLTPREQYLSNLGILKDGDIPVSLWVYIGIRKTKTGNCAYTYGLKEFQKQEIEIIDSKLSLEELFDFLYSIISYVLDNDITLNKGETIGLSADQKIPVDVSKGQFVEGQSIKLKL